AAGGGFDELRIAAEGFDFGDHVAVIAAGEDVAAGAAVGADGEVGEFIGVGEVGAVGAHGDEGGEAVVVFRADRVGAVAAGRQAGETHAIHVNGVGFGDVVQGGDDVF